ncbi:AraC/XylS family transcriptional regulator [Streptomyces malaysiensis subsp. malaysiensis]|nr:AraC/XylS family transcriptional regulator [Streptomyces malaysiensis]
MSLSAIISSGVGGIAVALITYLTTRPRTRAEARKLEAEAERTKAETAKLLAESATQLTSEVDSTDLPKGWHVTGGQPEDYSYGLDNQVHQSGTASAFIRARPNPRKFGSLIQSFHADDYTGKRVRLSAMIRTKDVTQYAAIWLRVDAQGRSIAFENTQSESRKLSGTRGWTRSEIVLDVPPEGEKILLGAFLSGNGCIWIDSFTFEVVGDDVPLTEEPAQESSTQPVNLGFTKGLN